MRTLLNVSKNIHEGLITLVKKTKTRSLGSLFESNAEAQAARSYSAAVTRGIENNEQIILKEHGLSEIISESVHRPTIIGQTPVHSPLIPKLPEHYIEVEGQIIEYPKGPCGLATTYKITPAKPNEYIEIHIGDYKGPGKKVQFYDDEGFKVDALIKIPRTSKATREEYVQWLEDINKNGFRRTVEVRTISPLKPQESYLEKTIKSLVEPKGTVEKLIRLDGDGNTIVRFLDKEGSFIRKVKINPDGKVLEYSNFRTLLSPLGIKKDAQLSRRFVGCPLEEEFELAKLPYPFEEQYSNYMRIREESRYILDFKGEVERTVQTRKFTPHEYGKIGDTPLITTVDARSMGDGRFVEDVVIVKGDKRFAHSFWFHQRTGNVYQMEGWCKGFTKEEKEILQSDPFLASRFYNDGLDFVRAEKFNAYNTQGLRDKQTPLTFEIPDNPNEYGHYQHYNSMITRRHINLTPNFVVNGNRSRIVNTEHHEPRHGFQHQMEEDLYAGLLEGDEKSRAEIFANNFANYKDPKRYGHAAYFSQPVEVDARCYGEAAQKQFDEFAEKENHILFNA